MADHAETRRILSTAWDALGGPAELVDHVAFTQPGALDCHFAVADLAAGLMGAAGLAVAELVAELGGPSPEVTVHRARAIAWFHTAIEPEGWAIPPFWHPVCADYRAADGWIRLHTNIPSHARAVLQVLDVPSDPARVAAAVGRWTADDLEAAVLAAGGAAARLRSRAEWLAHEQGRAVGGQELAAHSERTRTGPVRTPAGGDRPLGGIRVLDLTRGVAGPVASRCLAAFGADVLRIDPVEWEEPAVVPDVALGKRRGRIDLRAERGRAALRALVRQADVVVHGYRPGALAWLALADEDQEFVPPGLVDVTLNAYGWAGPWVGRRGFDSLVQMSCGMAEEAMRAAGSDTPVHLPMQALDQGTGYLMAAAAVRALTERARTGRGRRVHCSLARTAEVLLEGPRRPDDGRLDDRQSLFAAGEVVPTHWGAARRLPMPIEVAGSPMRWDVPAGPLGSHSPTWDEQP